MINIPFRRFLALGAVGTFTASAFATLVPIGSVSLSGQGLGAVNTIVTFQNTGTEVGAVGLLPASGGTEVTGGSVAFFGSTTALGGTTHETAGNAGSNLYSASSLGLTSFSNVVLLFNGTESQSPAGQPITLTNLALNLYHPTTGALLGSFDTADDLNFQAVFQGVGSAGFGFQLDAPQAAQANALLAANSNLVIGAAARATGADAGPETVSIATLAGGTPGTPPSGVPDSGASIALMGLGFLCLAAFRRKFGR